MSRLKEGAINLFMAVTISYFFVASNFSLLRLVYNHFMKQLFEKKDAFNRVNLKDTF
jgi:hypothetical protein